MPINLHTFRIRAFTAVGFVAVMLAGLLGPHWAFISLFIFIHFGCWYEFISLLKKIYGPTWRAYSFVGLLYITVPIAGILYLRLHNITVADPANPTTILILPHFLLPCAIIFSIWINDTMAYLVGSVIGSTPFSKISPKKTWEGTAGGAILCVVTIAIMGYYIPDAKAVIIKHWIAIASICAVFGTVGDLWESKLKRMAGVKDSGSIMPGHGGFLDRFDSLLVALPVACLYIILFV